MKDVRTITVLRGFDGFTGTVVERVERTVRPVLTSHIPGQRGSRSPGRYWVSYKGKRYVTFALPASYGDLAGLCINREFCREGGES